MNASSKIIEYLKQKKIAYEVLEHPVAYTALEIADKQHITGKKILKSVVVNVDERPILCVLPAIHMIDFESLRAITGGVHIRLATEDEIAMLFPDFEIGAFPPFGELYGLKVFMDKYIENDDTIVFNAGTHTDMIKIAYQDYIRVANPLIAEFGTHI